MTDFSTSCPRLVRCVSMPGSLKLPPVTALELPVKVVCLHDPLASDLDTADLIRSVTE
jgi:hypothetical protein